MDELLDRSLAGDVDAVKRLIEQSVDLNRTSGPDQVTALHLACENGHSDLAKYLVENGANPNAVNSLNQTALWFACDNGHAELARYLMANGASTDVGENPLIAAVQTAVRHRNATTIGAPLQEDGAAVNPAGRHYSIRMDTASWKRQTAETVSLEDMISVIRLLLQRGLHVNAVEKKGTALYCACRQLVGEEVAHILLEAGADVNLKTSNKLNPLIAACEAGNAELVDLIIKTGADVNVRNDYEETCLHVAMKTTAVWPHAVDACVRAGAAELVYLIAKAYAEDVVSITYSGQQTIIHFVSSISQKLAASAMNIIRSLLAAGIDTDACCHYGQTALYRAAESGHEHIVQLLVESDANANTGSSLPLHIAAENGKYQLMEVLLEHGANVNAIDDYGNTALHIVIIDDDDDDDDHAIEQHRFLSPEENSEKSVLDILLENGADVDLANRWGKTSLDAAASKGLLLDVANTMRRVYGGNPDEVSLNKSLPVACCLQQDVQLVDRPDPNLVSTTGDLESTSKSPLSVADEVVTLLGGGRSVQTVLRLTVKNLMYSPGNHDISAAVQAIRLLFSEHGADVNIQIWDGFTVLSAVVTTIRCVNEAAQRRQSVVELVELLQFMINHGAVLQDGVSPPPVYTFLALATFDDGDNFIINLFKVGAGFELVASCCEAVSPTLLQPQSIRLCLAAILAGYRPSADEVRLLRNFVDNDTTRHSVEKLLNWLDEDNKQPPSLMRQCRIVIRRQLSVKADFKSILPAIDKLELAAVMKQYLLFEGPWSEVDLSADQRND